MTYQQISAAFLCALGTALKAYPGFWLRTVEMCKVNGKFYRFEASGDGGDSSAVMIPISKFDKPTEAELDAYMTEVVIPDVIEGLCLEEEPEEGDGDQCPCGHDQQGGCILSQG